MKALIFAIVLASGVSASAAQVPKFKCQVPTTQPSVTATVSVSDNETIDFVTIDLNDKGASTLFIQMEKGGFDKQVTAGGVTSLILEDKFSQGDDGVIRNAGIFAISFGDNKWTGLLSARGNIYPLECTSL